MIKNMMDKYTMYCTQDQAYRAYKLGAKLDYCPSRSLGSDNMVYIEQKNEDDEPYYITPTTQQMIGWLEEKGVVVSICQSDGGHYYYTLRENLKEVCEWNSFDTRKHAEIGAIDAAIEYLESNDLNSIINKECAKILNSLSTDERLKFTKMVIEGDIIQATKYIAEQTKCGLKTARLVCDYIKEK